MKKLPILLLVLFALSIGCKKDNSSKRTSEKKVTYVFMPGGASSQMSYATFPQGSPIVGGSETVVTKNTDYSVDDNVIVGEQVDLIMSMDGPTPSTYSVMITYNGKTIAVASDLTTFGNKRTVRLTRSFKESDFN